MPISRQIQSEYGTAKNRVQDNLSCFETSLGIGDSTSQMLISVRRMGKIADCQISDKNKYHVKYHTRPDRCVSVNVV